MKAALAGGGTLLLILCFCSCAKVPEQADPRAFHLHDSLEGSVEDNLARVQSSEFASGCDKKWQKIQLEIARDLDLRQATALQSGTPSPSQRSLPRGWQDVIHLYQVVKDRPDDHNWAQVNASVRSILLDDVRRVVDGVNFYLDRDSGPSVLSVKAQIEICQANPACLSPNLAGHEAFINGQPLYSHFVDRLKEPGDDQSKRGLLARFYQRVNADADRYAFYRNSSVSRPDAGTFLLPLDGTALAGQNSTIQGYIESIWKTDGKAVKILWQDAFTGPGIFRALLHPSLGARAAVSRGDNVIHLYPDTDEKTVAHEIGHVLGFPDTYFSVWDNQNCHYTEQSREDDLMSDSDLGLVLPEHWETLGAEVAPFAGKTPISQ